MHRVTLRNGDKTVVKSDQIHRKCTNFEAQLLSPYFCYSDH